MKLSKFNSTIEISEKYNLHYNALNDSFMISKKDYKLSLDAHKEELQKLINKGFIVDKNTDENEILEKRARLITSSDTSFHLIVNPTLDCNFSCWYCYEEKQKDAVMTEETLNSVLKLLLHLREKHQHIHVSFFGGEPLMGFQKIIIPIYETLEKSGCSYDSSFTTNGSLISKNMLDYLQTKKVSNMQITLDGNKDSHNKTRVFANGKGSYDRIMKNIIKLLQRNISVTLRINYTPENIHTIQNVVNDIVALIPSELTSLLIVRFHQVWQTMKIDLSEEIDGAIELLISKGIRAIKPVFNNVYSPCYADYEHSALINYNGDIFKCTAVDFLNSQRDGYLTINGEIKWENKSNERRLDSRFKNKACSKCRIQPLCNGGCSQKTLHCKSKDICILGFDEPKKDEVIKERFIAYLQSEQLHFYTT